MNPQKRTKSDSYPRSATTCTPCGGGSSTSASGTADGEIPEETAGPYPGDGSNGPNVLSESGVVRSDITKSFGDASGEAEGVPATIEMTLLDVAGGGSPLAGAAVYVWHCDSAGRYSLYDQGVAEANYLRGVQESDATKLATSQLAIPQAVCEQVYATAGYEQSVANLAQTSLDTDIVFSDGYKSQLATTSGSAESGIAMKLNVGV